MMKLRSRQWGSRLAALAAVMLFHVLAILAVVYLCFFRAEFLNDECEKYQVASLLGISGEELRHVTEELMLRVKGQDGDMALAVTAEGSTRAFFNQRDVEHLDDIAGMIKKAGIACGLGALCLAGLLCALLRGGRGALLCRTYLFSWLFWLGLLLGTGAWILWDMTGFINSFHRLFFRDSRWILNPAKDMLIWLFPRELFRDAAILLAVWLAGIHGTAAAVSCLFLRRKKMRAR